MTARRIGRKARWSVAAVSLTAAGALTIALGAAAAAVTARDVTRALFAATSGKPVDLAGADLEGLDLAGLDFKRARLSRANLYGADLTGANLASTDLEGARLDRATIIKAEFSNANLNRATLLRPNVFSGFEVDVREAPRFAGAQLVGAQIVARLDGTDFRWANLTDAVFGTPQARREVLLTSQVWLNACDFSEATLTRTFLSGASLRFAHFTGADVRGTNFRGSDLTRADFQGAKLAGADFTGANVDEANFTGAEGIAEAIGLTGARNYKRAILSE